MAAPSWAEAKAMGQLERKAFLYARAINRGANVDWTTGKIVSPT